MSRKSELDVAIEKNKAEIEALRAKTDERIRELTVVNDALEALQEAKRKLRKPKPLTAAEWKAGA